MGNSNGGIGLLLISTIEYVVGRVIKARGLVNVLKLVAFILECDRTSHVFEITVFIFNWANR